MRSLLPLLSAAAPALAGIVYNDQIDGAYDFVIAGGGLAGLVLASRLSEDTNTTVLVLEAGASGDAVKARIDIPGNAYYSSLLNTEYDWQYKTVPQTKLENRVLPWPRGKVLGGSTAVNGLYLVRPSAIEVDAWSQLLPAQSSAAAWSWASLFEAMKKSETFTEPSEKIKTAGRIQYDVTSHGRSGPLHYAYPGFIVPIVGDWTSTLEWIGIPPSPDANGGSGWGGFIATSSINPSNWTRSYSRSAYIDPLPPRANLAILPNATVTKIIWADGTDGNGKKVAQGVEFASVRGGARRNVTARKEVILAGGAIGSPHIAMHSGFGPRDVLERIGIPVVYELPGVGTHLQDHIATEVVFRTSAETAASIRGSGVLENGTAAPFLSFINSAIAYANITDLFGDWAPTFQQQIRANMTDAINNLVNTDPRVRKGYQAVYEATTEKILMSPAGQVELLFSLTGTSQGSDTIAIQAALQHPFSHGHLFINTTDPFDPPVIDPQYLSNPGDTWMVREGLKLARKLGVTQPLNGSIIEEVSPGASVQTDAQWDAWLAGKIQTEYHPSCTMSMLPEDHAGVVDSDLRMYGTSNVRVVDSSVYPIQFAAHLMAPTYGLAEQAASIIRAQYNGVPPPASTVSTSAPGSATQTGTSPGNGGGSGSNAALPKRVETMRPIFDMDGPEAAKLCDDATLARLARTSRLSFELAIPILWGSVQGVHKILALLPGTVIGRAKKSDPPPKVIKLHHFEVLQRFMGLYSSLKQTPPLFLDTVDFTRFSVYASYVRTLAIYDPMDARRNIVIYYNWAFIQYLSQLRLLFPNLKTLVMNHTRGNPVYEKWIVAFASHELKAVFAPLIADPGMLPYPPSISLAAASLATTRLAHKSPSLEVLEIYPIASSAELNTVDQCATSPYSLVPDTPYQKFYGSFEGLKSLRKLSITAIALESNMFHVLAMLPCLEDLTIHSTSHRLPNFYLAPIPSGSFPSLTKLSLVDVDQANLEQAWESEPLVRKLRSLAVQWSYLGHTPLEWAKKTFLPLLRTRSPDLEDFRCESRRPGMVSEVLFSLGLADLK